MGAIQSSDSFPWFRFKLTPSLDEVEAEDAREAAAAAPESSGGTARHGAAPLAAETRR